jgi:uncharacterized protein (DUF305 family)
MAAAVATAGQQAPIIQPGAPGAPSRPITAADAADVSGVTHTFEDIEFMRGMIGHHAQALEMTALRPTRSRLEPLRLLALRIEISQNDEIKAMQEWLVARGVAPGTHTTHGVDAPLMPGMLTADEMARLTRATGTAFDRLFLEFMIKHHEGALLMVDKLFATPGAGQEPQIFAFASDVVDDQRAEIARMAALLKELR